MRPRRRKRWSDGLPDLTPIARALWAVAYPARPWPRYRVAWAGFMRGAAGLCIYSERRILLSYGDSRMAGRDVLVTLLHELTHAAGFKRHNKEFHERLALAQRRVWEAVS